jgi:hypothetical protein
MLRKHWRRSTRSLSASLTKIEGWLFRLWK